MNALTFTASAPVVLATLAVNTRIYIMGNASDRDGKLENSICAGARRESTLNSPSPCDAMR